MRPVASADELEGAIEGARREAEAAFGDPTVFLERYLQRPRHIEIQLLADAHGTTVSLGERECSIQRRHQKVVEEAPSPAVDAELRERLGAAAVAAAEAVGYVGAGTVEFMLAEDGEFHFLEMNTRLQVEHPVTEMVLGVDLVAEQLRIAAGEPIGAAARRPVIHGHAIEARLYSEDPAGGYLPQAGILDHFEIERGRAVRRPPRLARSRGPAPRLGVEGGSVVSPHYDPMLAKLIAWAPSRAEAAARLASAIERARIDGVVTNRDLLVRILRDPEYLDGGRRHGLPGAQRGAARAARRRRRRAPARRRRRARRDGGAEPRAPASCASLPAGFRNNFSERAADRVRGRLRRPRGHLRAAAGTASRSGSVARTWTRPSCARSHRTRSSSRWPESRAATAFAARAASITSTVRSVSRACASCRASQARRSRSARERSSLRCPAR